MGTPKVITLGCRLNTFESEVMREIGADAGLDDAIIINTCAVTAEAERQARQTIRRAKRDNPDARIIVTGCAAQLNADAFAAMRTARDAKLKMPALIIPSVQVNMRAGHMPPPEANGTVYLKTPINKL